MTASELVRRVENLLRKPAYFAKFGGGLDLRFYQLQALAAVVDSIRNKRGLSFVWIFPRQSGKDETLAILVQYLLTLFQIIGGEIVFFNPTFKPQTETSMRRLETRLSTNVLTTGKWKRRFGYIFKIGQAHCTYMSADPSAHVVSATASLLLVTNEAQDVEKTKFDKDADPMAASTNATKLFTGTRWTDDTLLERELVSAQAAEKADGIKRVFFYTADDVRQVVPAYGRHVDGVIKRLGRQHPLVKTQYFCETITSQAGMFPPARQALMHGRHAPGIIAEPGKIYAAIVDVGGQDEAMSTGAEILKNPGRDSTFLKIVEIDLSAMGEIGKPTYLVRFRKDWQGAKHTAVYSALRALQDIWHPKYWIMDATGVGEGLYSLMENAYGERIIPVKFTAQEKSEIGYGFLAIVETGRYREYHPFDDGLRLQMDKCKAEVIPGPAKLMRFGVPDGTRDEATGDLVHDDDLMTSAMTAILDRLTWFIPTEARSAEGFDPLNFGQGY